MTASPPLNTDDQLPFGWLTAGCDQARPAANNRRIANPKHRAAWGHRRTPNRRMEVIYPSKSCRLACANSIVGSTGRLKSP